MLKWARLVTRNVSKLNRGQLWVQSVVSVEFRVKEKMNSTVEVRPQKSAPWIGQKKSMPISWVLGGLLPKSGCRFLHLDLGNGEVVLWDLGIFLPMSGPVRVQKSSWLRQNRPVNTNIVSRAGALWFGQCFSCCRSSGLWGPQINHNA